MKNWSGFLAPGSISVWLLIFPCLHLLASLTDAGFMVQILNIGIIPLLMIPYFIVKRVMSSLYTGIFGLYFVGIIFRNLPETALFLKISDLCYLVVFVVAIGQMVSPLKKACCDKWTFIYLGTAVVTNSYLLYSILFSMQHQFADLTLLGLTALKGFALMLMFVLMFGIYLTHGHVPSVLFMAIILCLGFYTLVEFINTNFLDYWAFEVIQNSVQAIGLILYGLYVKNAQQIRLTEEVSYASRPYQVVR